VPMLHQFRMEEDFQTCKTCSAIFTKQNPKDPFLQSTTIKYKGSRRLHVLGSEAGCPLCLQLLKFLERSPTSTKRLQKIFGILKLNKRMIEVDFERFTAGRIKCGLRINGHGVHGCRFDLAIENGVFPFLI
jgi:hypothetical protein